MKKTRGVWQLVCAVALVLMVAISTSSCDAIIEPRPVDLSATTSFRFEFSTQGVTPGQTLQVQSEESANLQSELDRFGYTKAEVISATVTSVELERINPTSIDLSVLDEALLAFSASDVSTKNVASSESLPGSRTANLQVGTSSDVTSFVTAPSFRGSLTVVPNTVPQGGFVLRATVTFRIQAEGV